MSSRLPAHIEVGGLLRAAEAAGGNGVVLSRGDPDAGALLLVLTCRGDHPILLERIPDISASFTWNKVKRGESMQYESVARFVDERKRFDRDLWVLELDVPNVEQFIVDSLPQT